MATKQSPAASVRESIAIRPMSASPGCRARLVRPSRRQCRPRSAPTAPRAMTPATARAGAPGRSSPPPRRRRAARGRRFPGTSRGPCPRSSTRSPDRASCIGPLDRRLTIDDGEVRRRLRTGSATSADPIRRHHDAALDFLDDLLRVLGARVVGGNHHQIAQPRSDGAHQRALRPIAIAAAAKDGDDAAAAPADAPSRAGSSAHRRCARSRRRRARRLAIRRRPGIVRARASAAAMPFWMALNGRSSATAVATAARML